MTKHNSLIIWLEVIWWVVTAIVVYAVLRPIHQAMYTWQFEVQNIIFIVTLITLARYTFLLPHTLIARQQILKIVLMLAMIPLTTFLVNGLNHFMLHIEEHTWDPITGHLPAYQKKSTEDYIWGEMLFFAVGSIISAPVFAVRLMISIWRVRNRNTV